MSIQRSNPAAHLPPEPDHLRCRCCGEPATYLLVDKHWKPIPSLEDGAGQGYCDAHAVEHDERALCPFCDHTRIRFEGYERLKPTYPEGQLTANCGCGNH